MKSSIKQMHSIWKSVFNTNDSIYFNSEFYALGGNSQQLQTILHKVSQQFTLSNGEPIEPLLAPLPKQLTIASLTKHVLLLQYYIDSFTFLQDYQPKKPNIFCLHPVSGIARAFQSLANSEHMNQFNIIALDAPAQMLVSQSIELLTNLNHIAKYTAAAMCYHQQENPLHMIGWSFGGQLALACYHQLQQYHRNVAYCGIIDARAPTIDATCTNESYIVRLWVLITLIAEHLDIQLPEHFDLEPLNYLHLTKQDIIEQLLGDATNVIETWLTQGNVTEAMSLKLKQFLAMLVVSKANFTASLHYDPDFLVDQLYVYTASAPRLVNEHSECDISAWERFCKDPHSLQIQHVIDVDHFSIIKDEGFFKSLRNDLEAILS